MADHTYWCSKSQIINWCNNKPHITNHCSGGWSNICIGMHRNFQLISLSHIRKAMKNILSLKPQECYRAISYRFHSGKLFRPQRISRAHEGNNPQVAKWAITWRHYENICGGESRTIFQDCHYRRADSSALQCSAYDLWLHIADNYFHNRRSHFCCTGLYWND